MKRVFLLAAVLIVTSTWARPARAQLGILSLGGNTGISNQLANQKNLSRKKLTKPLLPPPVIGAIKAHGSQPIRGNSAAADRYGRVDLVGHQISGYPAIRGDITSANAATVSRGGANGQGRRGRR